jgi:hypothetical protein
VSLPVLWTMLPMPGGVPAQKKHLCLRQTLGTNLNLMRRATLFLRKASPFCMTAHAERGPVAPFGISALDKARSNEASGQRGYIYGPFSPTRLKLAWLDKPTEQATTGRPRGQRGKQRQCADEHGTPDRLVTPPSCDRVVF